MGAGAGTGRGAEESGGAAAETLALASTDFNRILVVDDEEAMRHMLDLVLRREGYVVRTADSAEAAIAALQGQGQGAASVDVVLTDVRMPGLGGLGLVDWLCAQRPEITILVMSAFGSVELALEAMHRGAYDYISKPFKADEVVLMFRKAEERLRLRRENAALKALLVEQARTADRLGEMLVHSDGVREVAKLVRKVAAYKTTVLVLGESGVGKELVSRALHAASPRASGPFVAVNCGAIPGALLESELFGHVKGAFTDAHADRRGLFEEAGGGTLFLDEIGELPLPLQVKLLRVLQEEEIRRVGDTRAVSIDVRVVAATSRDLQEMVEDGSFRRDLYFRVAVMSVEIPPLRDRKEDIAPLVEHFIAATNARLGTTIEGVTPDALASLLAYAWPGNVRELENTIERASVMADGSMIDLEALPERARKRGAPLRGFSMSFDEDDLSVKRAQRTLERELILRALHQTGGNRTHAAKLLDLSHRALLYKIKDFGLS